MGADINVKLCLPVVLVVLLCLIGSRTDAEIDTADTAGNTKTLDVYGTPVRLFFPSNFIQRNRYPFILLVVPSDSRASDVRRWQPIADSMGYILVVPSVNVGNALESVQRILSTRTHIDRSFKVDASRSLIIGIKESGPVVYRSALETPRKFPNSVVFYSAINPDHERLFNKNNRSGEYRSSQFVFVTGDGNSEHNAMVRFNGLLKGATIGSLLVVYPDLMDSFPDDLDGVVGRIKRAVDDNAKRSW